MTATSDRLPVGLAKRLTELYPALRVTAVTELGADAGGGDDTTKGVGYGRPLRVTLEGASGERLVVVLHVATADDFGHDRRADRAAEQLLAFDTFGLVPHHTRALDVGAVMADGSLSSLAGAGEFYLLTTWAEGDVYASDLRRLGASGAVTALDLARLDALVDVMADLHARPGTRPAAWTRAIRDLVGSGEGIAGLADAYGPDVPSAPRERIERLERACLAWRHHLAPMTSRLRRTHGDLHPFNIVFAPGSATPQLLDTSRGSQGDPADDVACLGINLLFFALAHPAAWPTGLGRLWDRYWARVQQGHDDALLSVLAPWLAWRVLVLANPTWYPHVTADERDRLLSFAERALAAPRFEPRWAHELMQGERAAEVSAGAVVWFTGLPSSGKSTLARATRRALGPLPCVVLDGDEVRASLTPAPGYDDASRADFYETLARLAATLAKQGLVVLVAATAHLRRFRDRARALSPRFYEVFVDTPPEVCRQRDTKGLYAAGTPHLPGADAAFEAPTAPALVVRPSDADAAGAVARLIGVSASASAPARSP
jgi:adenylylsulfate kinase-like enzyme